MFLKCTTGQLTGNKVGLIGGPWKAAVFVLLLFLFGPDFGGFAAARSCPTVSAKGRLEEKSSTILSGLSVENPAGQSVCPARFSY